MWPGPGGAFAAAKPAGGVTQAAAAPQRLSVQSLPLQTRVITYAYDGLHRLTGAHESPGSTYVYAYDLAGNRTDGGTTYNAANQITNPGYTYDLAGNQTSDGTAAATYDALGRMTARGGTTYTSNGDGVLVYDGTTRYTQDLAAPLTQILQTTQGSATTDYLYGLDRLAAVTGSNRTWYGTDALGSVRQTSSDAGIPLGMVNYDPWGTPETGTVPTFGFTGEVQDVGAGGVNLRARWYSTARGRFTSVDPFAGMMSEPQTLGQYPYAENNPILKVDPSGHLAIFVAGWFGTRPTSGSERPGIWDMAERFKSFIPGDTIISDPSGPKAWNGILPTPSRNDIVDSIINKIEAISANSPGACAPVPQKHEPIILVGHSRGAGTIQQVLGELYQRDPDIRIDLVVTLGLLPVSQRDWWHPSVNLNIKQPNVDRHINLMSQAGALFGGPMPASRGGLVEHHVAGADFEKTIVGTTHAALDDEYYAPTCDITLYRYDASLCEEPVTQGPDYQYEPVKGAHIHNEVWTIVEQAIRAVVPR